MKLVHYTGSLSRSAGGLYYSVSGLAKAQALAGHDVTVVGGADEFLSSDIHQWDNLKVYALRPFGRYGYNGGALKIVERLNADIVHIHGIWSASSLYGRLLSASGKPVVVSPRGMLDPWIVGRHGWTKRLHGALVERPLLAKCYIHALAPDERDAVVRYLPEAVNRTFVIPNGIALPENISAGKPKSGFLFLGRLHPKKQVLELLDRWNALGDAAPNLTVAGWGDPSYVAEVSSRVVNNPRINVVGPLYGDAKAVALAEAQFFILPSRSEGLPMAVLEAIAHGCIPVLTRQCNLPGLFDEEIAIQIGADFSDFEPIMKGLLEKPADWLQDCSRRASEKARDYAWGEIANAMLEKYDEILRSHRH